MRRNIRGASLGFLTTSVKTLELTNEEFDKLAANAFVIPQGKHRRHEQGAGLFV